jgi:hypothetical protein
MATTIHAVYFKTLKPGNQFAWREGELLKTKNMGLIGKFGDLPSCGAGSQFNCICIETGEPYYVEDNELVIPVKK